MVQINVHGNAGGDAFQRAQQLHAETARNPQYQATRDFLAKHSRSPEGRFQAEAAAIYKAQSQASSRFAAPLRPSTYASAQREMDRLHYRADQFQRRWGVNPFRQDELSGMRRGLGTEAGAHRTAETLRMGSVGQRYAFEGNYRGVAHLERELRKIDRDIEKQSKFEQSPAAQANLQRQKDAMLHARSRIDAGFQGTNPLVRRVGMAWGRVSNTFHDPVVQTGMDATLAAIAAPYVSNRMLSGVIGMGRPYRDFINSQYQVALASGGRFQGATSASTLLNMGATGLMPGKGLSAYAGAFGLDPKKVPTEVLNDYGVPLRNANDESRIAASVRMAHLSGGMQIPESALFKGLGSAVTAGAVANDQAGWNEYFRQLQPTMAIAMQRGIDKSKMAAGFTSLIQGAASGGAGFSFGGLAGFYRSLVGTAPGGRTGALQSSIMSGIRQSGASLGDNNAATIATGFFLSAHPEATRSARGLQHALGMSDSAWADLTSSPASQRLLHDYLDAARAGNPFATQRYLGALLQNSPDAFKKIAGGVPVPAYQRDLVTGRVANVSVAASAAWNSARPGAGAAAMRSTGAAPYIPPDVYEMVKQEAAKAGVPLSVALALVGTESGGRQYGRNGGVLTSDAGAEGLTQVLPSTASSMGYDPSDLSDARKNLRIGLQYLKQRAQKAGDWDTGYLAYHGGAGPKGYAAMGKFDSYLLQYAQQGKAIANLRTDAVGSAADLQGSKYVAENTNTEAVAAAFTRIVNAGDHVAHVFDGLAAAGGRLLHNLATSAMTPAPWAIPNDSSTSVRK